MKNRIPTHMKNLLPLFAGLLVLTSVAQAGPIQQNQIAADARWVAHVDVDRLLQSRFGEHVAREFVDKHLAKPTAKLRTDLGVDVDWRKIHSVTAYGWNLKGKEVLDGVLLIQADMDLPAMLDVVAAKLGQNPNAESPLQKFEENDVTIYQVRNEAYGAAAKSGGFVVARTKERLLDALKAASGRGNSPALSKLASVAVDKDAFLLFGVAADFNELANLPKQAQVLQQAEGARLTAGEKAENVFVTLSLDTRTVEAATQIQQLVQGLIALGNLNGDQNADLQKLAQAARVDSKEKQVTLALQMPVQDVITKVDEVNKPGRKAKAK